MSKARIGLGAGVIVAGFVISQASWGWFLFDLFHDPTAILGTLIWTVWLAFPYFAVAVAILDGVVSRAAIAVGLTIAVAGTIFVPRLTNAAIEDHPSSTASLLHLYDPALVLLALGAVYGLDFIVRRRARRSY